MGPCHWQLSSAWQRHAARPSQTARPARLSRCQAGDADVSRLLKHGGLAPALTCHIVCQGDRLGAVKGPCPGRLTSADDSTGRTPPAARRRLGRMWHSDERRACAYLAGRRPWLASLCVLPLLAQRGVNALLPPDASSQVPRTASPSCAASLFVCACDGHATHDSLRQAREGREASLVLMCSGTQSVGRQVARKCARERRSRGVRAKRCRLIARLDVWLQAWHLGARLRCNRCNFAAADDGSPGS